MHRVTWGKNLQLLTAWPSNNPNSSAVACCNRGFNPDHMPRKSMEDRELHKMEPAPSQSLRVYDRQERIWTGKKSRLLGQELIASVVTKGAGSHLEMHSSLVNCVCHSHISTQPHCSAASYEVHSTTHVLVSLLIFSYFWWKMCH